MNWLLTINKKLGNRIIAMLAIALTLAVVSVIFADTWVTTIRSHDERIMAIRDNLIAMNELNADMFEAQSAQRGFILTGEEAYFLPFNDAIDNARKQLHSIKGLVRADGTLIPEEEEQKWLLDLSTIVESRITTMQLTSLLVKQGKAQEAKEVILTKKGLVDSYRIKDHLGKMMEVQNKAIYALRESRHSTINLTRISVYGSAIVLLLLVIMVIKQLLSEMAARDQLREQLNTELVNYELQLEEQTRLLKVLALDAQSDVERERQKLARELHDELGSILTATKMDVSWSIRKARELVPEVSEKLSKTMRYLDQGIQFKREVVQHLRPSMIETFGFWPALRSLIDDVAARNHWEMDVILPEETAEISEVVSLIIYRVIQESLNNATKYAKATKITLHMMVDMGHLKLELEDNGVGMDMSTVVEGTTHGLKGMKNRVMAIGGRFELESVPGEGTSIRVIIPIGAAPA